MALPHTKTSGAARTAVFYITVGAIMDVWTVLWFWWMLRHGTSSDGPYFWCYGFFLTGLTLVIIGLAVGQIGRAARHAEAPPDTTSSNAAVAAQQPVARIAAAPAPVQAPMTVPAGAVTPGAPAQPVLGPAGTLQPR
jgi:hypothetical protein